MSFLPFEQRLKRFQIENGLSPLFAFQTYPASMAVSVAPGYVYIDDVVIKFEGGISPDFTPPSVDYKIDVLGLDADTAEFVVIEGTPSTDPQAPERPANIIPIAEVYLASNDESITQVNIKDIRPIFNFGSGIGIGVLPSVSFLVNDPSSVLDNEIVVRQLGQDLTFAGDGLASRTITIGQTTLTSKDKIRLDSENASLDVDGNFSTKLSVMTGKTTPEVGAGVALTSTGEIYASGGITVPYIRDNTTEQEIFSFVPGLNEVTNEGFIIVPSYPVGTCGLILDSTTVLEYSTSTQLDYNICHNFDPNQGTIRVFVTPSWNGDDALQHPIFYIDQTQDTTDGYIFSIQKEADGTLKFSITKDSFAKEVSVDVSDWRSGVTHQIVAVWDFNGSVTLDSDSGLGLYIDGVGVYGDSSSDWVKGVEASSATIVLGRNPAGAVLDGAIVGFLIKSRPVSATEVLADFQSANASLYLYYLYDHLYPGVAYLIPPSGASGASGASGGSDLYLGPEGFCDLNNTVDPDTVFYLPLLNTDTGSRLDIVSWPQVEASEEELLTDPNFQDSTVSNPGWGEVTLDGVTKSTDRYYKGHRVLKVVSDSSNFATEDLPSPYDYTISETHVPQTIPLEAGKNYHIRVVYQNLDDASTMGVIAKSSSGIILATTSTSDTTRDLEGVPGSGILELNYRVPEDCPDSEQVITLVSNASDIDSSSTTYFLEASVKESLVPYGDMHSRMLPIDSDTVASWDFDGKNSSVPNGSVVSSNPDFNFEFEFQDNGINSLAGKDYLAGRSVTNLEKHSHIQLEDSAGCVVLNRSTGATFSDISSVASIDNSSQTGLNFDAVTDFTFEFWYSLAGQTPTTSTILEKGVGYSIQVTSGAKITATIGDVTATSTTSMSDDFAHIAVVVDRTLQTLRLYVNGVSEVTRDLTLVGSLINSDDFTVGNGSVGTLVGTLGQIRLSSKVRTEDELNISVSYGFHPDTDTISIWEFNGTADDVVGPNDLTTTSVEYISGPYFAYPCRNFNKYLHIADVDQTDLNLNSADFEDRLLRVVFQPGPLVEGVTGTQVLVEKDDGSSGYSLYLQDDASIYFRWRGPSGTTDFTSDPLDLSLPYHTVSIHMSETTAEGYVDSGDHLISTYVGSPSPHIDATNTADFVIGANSAMDGGFFTGIIGDVYLNILNPLGIINPYTFHQTGSMQVGSYTSITNVPVWNWGDLGLSDGVDNTLTGENINLVVNEITTELNLTLLSRVDNRPGFTINAYNPLRVGSNIRGGSHFKSASGVFDWTLDDFSVGAWVYPSSATENFPVFQYGIISDPSSLTGAIFGVLLTSIQTGSNTENEPTDYSWAFLLGDNASHRAAIVADQVVRANEWVYLEATFDKTSGEAKIYENGVLIGSGDASNLTGTFIPGGSVSYYVGRIQGNTVGSLLGRGKVDQVRISSTARTSQEILDTYQLCTGWSKLEVDDNIVTDAQVIPSDSGTEWIQNFTAQNNCGIRSSTITLEQGTWYTVSFKVRVDSGVDENAVGVIDALQQAEFLPRIFNHLSSTQFETVSFTFNSKSLTQLSLGFVALGGLETISISDVSLIPLVRSSASISSTCRISEWADTDCAFHIQSSGGDLLLKDKWLLAPVPLSEDGVTGLAGSFTATSIIGALNELALSGGGGGGGSASSLDDAYDGSGGAGSGRTVTVDSGAVRLLTPGDASTALELGGDLIFNTDGVSVIGQDGDNRPFAIYVKDQVKIGDTITMRDFNGYVYNEASVFSSGIRLADGLTNPPSLVKDGDNYVATLAYYTYQGNTYDGGNESLIFYGSGDGYTIVFFDGTTISYVEGGDTYDLLLFEGDLGGGGGGGGGPQIVMSGSPTPLMGVSGVSGDDYGLALLTPDFGEVAIPVAMFYPTMFSDATTLANLLGLDVGSIDFMSTDPAFTTAPGPMFVAEGPGHNYSWDNTPVVQSTVGAIDTTPMFPTLNWNGSGYEATYAEWILNSVTYEYSQGEGDPILDSYFFLAVGSGPGSQKYSAFVPSDIASTAQDVVDIMFPGCTGVALVQDVIVPVHVSSILTSEDMSFTSTGSFRIGGDDLTISVANDMTVISPDGIRFGAPSLTLSRVQNSTVPYIAMDSQGLSDNYIFMSNDGILKWTKGSVPTQDNSGLRVGCVANVHVVTNATNYEMTIIDEMLVVNNTTPGASNVTLPTDPVTGIPYTIKDGKGDASSNNITITATPSTIDGASSIVISANYQSITLVYNGTEWSII